MTIEHKVFIEKSAAEKENEELRAGLLLIAESDCARQCSVIARRLLSPRGSHEKAE